MISALIEVLANYYQSGDFTHVEAIARTISAAIPDDVISLKILGLAYLRTGRMTDAIRMFRKAEQKDNRAADADMASDGSADERTALAAAICYYEATRANPVLARLWHDLGCALLLLKRPEQAASAFRAALLARPDYPAALRALEACKLPDRTAPQKMSEQSQQDAPAR